MSGPPTKCTACGHEFGSRSVVPGPDKIPVFDYYAEEPCPRCGAWVITTGWMAVPTPSGEWMHLATALRPPDATFDDYVRLSDALRAAAARPGAATPAESAAAAVEQVPIFGPLAEWIKAHPETSRWIVTVLLGVLTIILSRFPASSSSQPASPTEVHVTVDAPSPEQVQQWIRDAIAAHERAERAERDRKGHEPGAER